MIKVEVGQVWISNTNYTHMHMIINRRGEQFQLGQYELSGVAKMWSEEHINENYTLNRHADGTLVPIDTNTASE